MRYIEFLLEISKRTVSFYLYMLLSALDLYTSTWSLSLYCYTRTSTSVSFCCDCSRNRTPWTRPACHRPARASRSHTSPPSRSDVIRRVCNRSGYQSESGLWRHRRPCCTRVASVSYESVAVTSSGVVWTWAFTCSVRSTDIPLSKCITDCV